MLGLGDPETWQGHPVSKWNEDYLDKPVRLADLDAALAKASART